MANDWMQVTFNVYDNGSLLGNKTGLLSVTSSTGKDYPPLEPPKKMSAQKFFLAHLKNFEMEGWEVFSIDMNHKVPWYAILRKKIENT